MLTRRSLALTGARVGQTISPDVVDGTDRTGALPLRVVGAFDPVSVETPYWAGHPYFAAFYPHGVIVALVDQPPVADPVFLGQGTAQARGYTRYTIDVPMLPGRVGLADTAILDDQIGALKHDLSRYRLDTSSGLPAALRRAGDGRALVRIAAPLAVAQLVLLAWWTLFLVVGSATEERSPELGLAKLRGLTGAQTGRFGLAEVALLLLVAVPLGTALGYLAVRAAASRVFAPGTEVVLTPSVLLTVSLAFGGGLVTAALAAGRIFRRPVGDLLRRVPSRGSHERRAGLLEGVVVALAVAGVIQLVSDRGQRPSPVALLAPGMVAVVGGLLAGRLLVRVARNRSERALARGSAPHLVGWSGVARRPGTARIASVLAVATCLLLVGVEAWAVAERNRAERAAAETGAAVVLHVRAPGAHGLMDAVRAADPEGGYAMAAVQVTVSGQDASVLAVDSRRAGQVVRWGSPEAAPRRSLRSLVAPRLPPSLTVRPGLLELTATADRVASPAPLRLATRLIRRDGDTIRRPMGQLRRGRHTYRATVPAGCSAGCRLAAFSVSHPTTDLEGASVHLMIESIGTRAATATGAPGRAEPLAAAFPVPGSWRGVAPAPGSGRVLVSPGIALGVTVDTPGGIDAEVVRGDAPEPLPAYAGVDATAQRSETGALPMVEAVGLSGASTRFSAVRRGPYVPHAGRAAVLVDLELALRLSDTAPAGDRQVWLSRDDRPAEARLVAALRQHGVRVDRREAESTLQRRYAGDGAVLALRLLLVCGAAAVIVSVGALLVAAYVGRRQRAYEVAALRVVGVARRTVCGMLLRENVGTVLVALACGGAAALLATWVVLPSLPQFDDPSATVAVRYTPVAAVGWAALGGLALLLVAVSLAVATLQLRAGRVDQLREGVR